MKYDVVVKNYENGENHYGEFDYDRKRIIWRNKLGNEYGEAFSNELTFIYLNLILEDLNRKEK